MPERLELLGVFSDRVFARCREWISIWDAYEEAFGSAVACSC